MCLDDDKILGDRGSVFAGYRKCIIQHYTPSK